MNRREALFHTAALLGGTIVGSQVFLSGCSQAKQGFVELTEADVNFLNEVAEVIIPITPDSGGAKAANIGAFMKIIVTDCYDQSEADKFYSGIDKMNSEAKRGFSVDFMSLSSEQKFKLIATIDQEARDKDNHYFRMMKELTLWGYFSSEAGCKEALRYNPIPGRYEACIPYNNEPAWAG
ncbi:MAG: gluconate 2-dehydrogenase subunit 3 family protein [Cytophagia bacterium]|nr:gluconate 2-dehydrogenase subunit 3 family protein [Cytophagia bacterium]